MWSLFYARKIALAGPSSEQRARTRHETGGYVGKNAGAHNRDTLARQSLDIEHNFDDIRISEYSSDNTRYAYILFRTAVLPNVHSRAIMASNRGRTDIIIAIQPQHVANIISRVKDHEFRKYLIPQSVRRFWIYETSPASAIKYVAEVSAGKRPGEITNVNGLRNLDFNEGKFEAKFAYEIIRLVKLDACITLDDLKTREWLNGPPQKYCYVKQEMKDALRTVSTTTIFDKTLPLRHFDSDPSSDLPATGSDTDILWSSEINEATEDTDIAQRMTVAHSRTSRKFKVSKETTFRGRGFLSRQSGSGRS